MIAGSRGSIWKPASRPRRRFQVEGDLLLVAAGAWLPALMPERYGDASVYRQGLCYVEPPAQYEQSWRDAPAIAAIGDHTGYTLPDRRGAGLKIGYSAHRRLARPEVDGFGSDLDSESSAILGAFKPYLPRFRGLSADPHPGRLLRARRLAALRRSSRPGAASSSPIATARCSSSARCSASASSACSRARKAPPIWPIGRRGIECTQHPWAFTPSLRASEAQGLRNPS
jgi:hypothetical protein